MTNLTGPKTIDQKQWSVNDPDVFISNIRGTKVRYRRKSTGAFLSGWIHPLGPMPRPVATTQLQGITRATERAGRSMAYMGEQVTKVLAPLTEAVERMNPYGMYDKMTRDELRTECKERGLSGYGNMRKAELVNLLALDDRKNA